MTKKQEMAWVHVPPLERAIPATPITKDAVIEFRNGLRLFTDDEENSGLVGTAAYRALIDLDHLARLMDAKGWDGKITMSYVIKPKHKDAAKFAKALKKMRAIQRSKRAKA